MTSANGSGAPNNSGGPDPSSPTNSSGAPEATGSTATAGTTGKTGTPSKTGTSPIAGTPEATGTPGTTSTAGTASSASKTGTSHIAGTPKATGSTGFPNTSGTTSTVGTPGTPTVPGAAHTAQRIAGLHPPVAARLYFAIQALAGAAWWVSVFAIEAVRRATLGDLDAVLVAAFDLPLFVLASALVATGVRWAVWVAAPWTLLVAALMAVYATVTQLAGWGAVLMIAAAACSLLAGVVLLAGEVPGRLLLIGPFAFREARPAASRAHLGRTIAQMFVFWGFFLVVLPLAITWVEDRWRLHLDLPTWVHVSGVALLLAASALGVWSAVSMATKGNGTPLPAATASRLVIVGPYRFVRNPMAVAGIAQAVGVGLLFGSWLVVLYALAGSLLWNWAVRPLEEADLEARFGDDFAVYRSKVSCWVPRLSSRG